jgi:hypothetical protein
LKRYVPRSLWLLAWSFWAWLGWGLYRELPRDLGPVVCQLPMGDDETFLGWLAGEPTAVTIKEGQDWQPAVIRTWDAMTGQLRYRFEGPVRVPGVVDFAPCLRHGLIVCARRPDFPATQEQKTASVLDLKSGRWLDLPCDLGGCQFVPSEPLALFERHQGRSPTQVVDGAKVARNPEEDDWRVLVVDLRDGRILLRVTNAVGGQPPRDLRGAFFIDDDVVGIETSVLPDENGDSSPDDDRVEIWRLDSPGRPPTVVKGVDSEIDLTVSRTGRMAWQQIATTPGHVDVFDLREGRMILRHPPPGERKTNPGGGSGYWPEPIIAADGRSVFIQMGGMLLDVDTGEVLWKNSDGGILSVLDGAEQVIVYESWQQEWLPFLPKLETYAVRDMSSLRLVWRTWASTAPPYESSNDARQWHLDDETKFVYRLDPRVNYPLLALCQTILALPLVLLWAILRWRRKRAGAVEGAAA